MPWRSIFISSLHVEFLYHWTSVVSLIANRTMLVSSSTCAVEKSIPHRSVG